MKFSKAWGSIFLVLFFFLFLTDTRVCAMYEESEDIEAADHRELPQTVEDLKE